MGFFKKLFFGEEKEKTKIEEQVQENAESYSHALTENQVVCNGCGQIIDGKPRIREHLGKMLFFHKRCWKAMLSGNLPKPINQDQQNGSG